MEVADGDASAICDRGDRDTMKADLAGDFKGSRQDSLAGLARFRVGPALAGGSEREPYGRRRILPWGDSGVDRVLNSESVFKIVDLDQRLDCAKYCSVFNDVILLSHR